MKKIRNILIMSVFAICSLCVLGVNKVEAATLNYDFKLVCTPSELEPKEGYNTSNCYLVGTPKDTTGSVHGFVTQVYTTDALELKGAGPNLNATGTNVVFAKATSASTSQPMTGSNLPASLKAFRCTYDSSVAKDADYGCAVFYSTTDTNAFTHKALTTGNKAEMLPNGKESINADGTSKYAVIGSYQVELPTSVNPDDLQSCGEICVKAWSIPTKDLYDKYATCQSAVPEDGNTDCGDTPTVIQTTGNNNYFCEEIGKKGVLNDDVPPTGAFASYAVLVAGALIAISAIAIAKKNNKLYKI